MSMIAAVCLVLTAGNIPHGTPQITAKGNGVYIDGAPFLPMGYCNHAHMQASKPHGQRSCRWRGNTVMRLTCLRRCLSNYTHFTNRLSGLLVALFLLARHTIASGIGSNQPRFLSIHTARSNARSNTHARGSRRLAGTEVTTQRLSTGSTAFLHTVACQVKTKGGGVTPLLLTLLHSSTDVLRSVYACSSTFRKT